MDLIKRLLARSARSEAVWPVLDRLLVSPARYAMLEREQVVADRLRDDLVRRVFSDLTVRHGPFAGLRYPPNPRAVCSSLLPKLLGCYEQELHPAVERVCRQAPPLVVDVGCAEGYYAVGLARRLPASQVYAFDIEPDARRMCREMAEVNGVADRVVMGERCGPAELVATVAGRPALVVCDCEGYERDLLAAETVTALAASDLLIETHEFMTAGVTAELAARFEATHQVAVLNSVDDRAKVRTYRFPELDALDPAERFEVVAERRPEQMSWLHLAPRQRSHAPRES